MPYNPLITTNLSETQHEPYFIPPKEIVNRSKIGKLKPKEFLGFRTFLITCHPLYVFPSIVIESKITCFTKTITKPKWQATMSYEFDVLMANRTWSLCPRPLNKHVVINKWVYKESKWKYQSPQRKDYS